MESCLISTYTISSFIYVSIRLIVEDISKQNQRIVQMMIQA